MAMPRRRPLEDPKQYYAYVWRYEGVVLWVGHGKNNRGRPTCRASWSGRPNSLLDILEEHCHEIDVAVMPCPSKKEAIDLEARLIAELVPIHNTAPGTGGWEGMHTEDGLRRISEAGKNREYTTAERLARSRRMKSNQNLLGHRHSEETKAKISAAGKGHPASDLCKAKSSERAKERNVINPPRKGKKCSEDHRRKLSEAAKRRAK